MQLRLTQSPCAQQRQAGVNLRVVANADAAMQLHQKGGPIGKLIAVARFVGAELSAERGEPRPWAASPVRVRFQACLTYTLRFS
jgi:hypothetical protein